MATLTAQAISESGGVTFTAASAGGDSWQNTGREVLVVQNDDAASKTVTVTAQKTSTRAPGFGAVTKANAQVTVAAGGVEVFGPFPTEAYNDANGAAQITYSDVTSLSVAVVRLP